MISKVSQLSAAQPFKCYKDQITPVNGSENHASNVTGSGIDEHKSRLLKELVLCFWGVVGEWWGLGPYRIEFTTNLLDLRKSPTTEGILGTGWVVGANIY